MKYIYIHDYVNTESRQTHSNVLERADDRQNNQHQRKTGRTGLTGCADRSDRCKQGPRVDLE